MTERPIDNEPRPKPPGKPIKPPPDKDDDEDD